MHLAHSSDEGVKLHLVKVIGHDSTSNTFVSMFRSTVKPWFCQSHPSDVYGPFSV